MDVSRMGMHVLDHNKACHFIPHSSVQICAGFNPCSETLVSCVFF